MNLINFSNQLAAGPKNISLNFIKEILSSGKDEMYIFLVPSIVEYQVFKDTQNVKFLFVEVGTGFIGKILKTLRINWWIIPKICRTETIESILAFGNFLTYSSGAIKKVVLLHHPHIVDDELFYSLPISSKISESVKRLVFWLTIRNVDIVVVQSDYMLDQCYRKFPKYHSKFTIIHNPISRDFESNLSVQANNLKRAGFKNKDKFTLLYVSRFYPHKNHEFLIDLSKKFLESSLKIEILVTIDPLLEGANNFLESVNSQKLPIYNLNELSQQELAQYYVSADFMIFPSIAETFGNPIIEALFFSLPLILPNRGYAKALLGEGGAYYDPVSVDSCFHLLKTLIKNEESYIRYAEYCYSRSLVFPNSSRWVHLFKGLLRGSCEA